MLFRLFQIPEYRSDSFETIRHIAWNLLVTSSSYPPVQFLFSSMWFSVFRFVSSSVEIDTSNILYYDSIGLSHTFLRHSMVLVDITAY